MNMKVLTLEGHMLLSSTIFFSHKEARKSLTYMCSYKYHTLLQVVQLFSHLVIKPQGVTFLD
jgi:hypothetical protein